MSGKHRAVRADCCFQKPLINIVTWKWVVEGQWRPVTSLMKMLLPVDLDGGRPNFLAGLNTSDKRVDGATMLVMDSNEAKERFFSGEAT